MPQDDSVHRDNRNIRARKCRKHRRMINDVTIISCPRANALGSGVHKYLHSGMILWANCSVCQRFGVLAMLLPPQTVVRVPLKGQRKGSPKSFLDIGQREHPRDWPRQEKPRVKKKNSLASNLVISKQALPAPAADGKAESGKNGLVYFQVLSWPPPSFT